MLRVSGVLFPAAAAVAFVSLACSSSGDLGELYTRGIKAARADNWDTAVEDLEGFTGKGCGGAAPDRRCREAYLALGRGYERRGTPARAWVAFDAALALPPHGKDQAVRADLTRAEQQLRDKLDGAKDHGPVLIRYRDEVTDEYTPRSVIVTLDFNPVYTKDKGAGELRSPDYTSVYAGSLPAGDHVLLVEAAHGCKPGEGVKCAGSQLHRSWSFHTEARTPTSLEVRTYADPGEGDAPNRPTIEMHRH